MSISWQYLYQIYTLAHRLTDPTVADFDLQMVDRIAIGDLLNEQSPNPNKDESKTPSATAPTILAIPPSTSNLSADYSTKTNEHDSQTFKRSLPAHQRANPAKRKKVSNGQWTSETPASEPATMQGGPVLPAISELQRHVEPQQPMFRPLYAGTTIQQPGPQGPAGSNGSPPSQLIKRSASQTPMLEESPAKKQSKWTPEEDNLTIELRGQGMKWDDIAKRLPGRSSISCRLRYQNYLEKRAVWDEEKKE